MKEPTITFRATYELRAKLKKAAHRLEISQGDFICLALEVAIQKALQEAEPQLSYHAEQCEKQNEQGFPDREERA